MKGGVVSVGSEINIMGPTGLGIWEGFFEIVPTGRQTDSSVNTDGDGPGLAGSLLFVMTCPPSIDDTLIDTLPPNAGHHLPPGE